jgi:hypothetical protein
VKKAPWALLVVVLTACVGPARSGDSFEGKAGATATSMRSAVESARLTIGLASGRMAFAPYLSEAAHYAEDDATSIQGAFDSIQPPDAASDRLRSQLDGLLSGAVSALSDLRIAARRGDVGAMTVVGPRLQRLSRQLDAFASAHPSGGGS